MPIDAYDVLSVSVDCDQEEIRKAFKKLSLIHHPDKAARQGRNVEEQNERFIEIKEAYATLGGDEENRPKDGEASSGPQQSERRKRYDTFGTDLGAEAPEMEVWNIGLTTLLMPVGNFMLKTALCRFAIWLMSFTYVSYLILLCGIVCAILYAGGSAVPYGEQLRSEWGLPLAVNVGIINVVVILGWLSELLVDTVGVVYLATEVISFPMDMLYGGISIVVCLFFAWLLYGWWYWVLGLEAILGIVLLIGVTISAGIIRLWIDTVQATRGEKVKEWRQSMRKERKKLQDEVDDLKKKLQRSG